MSEITYFYLDGCPFCHQADKLIAELVAENPEFAAVRINKIEETQNKTLADSYNYFYVPCLWLGSEKLFEGVPTKEKIRASLSAAVNGLL
jgi:glutaredoxin